MKQIIFNTEMVKAILDGRKTQFMKAIEDNDLIDTLLKNGGHKTYDAFVRFSKYKVDDIIYVKETFAVRENGKILYKADYYDGFDIKYHWRTEWKKSSHLKREDARIFLRVANVRVERLNEITTYDMKKEGMWFDMRKSEIEVFTELWNSTSKEGYKWEDNPYVFVYEFERA